MAWRAVSVQGRTAVAFNPSTAECRQLLRQGEILQRHILRQPVLSIRRWCLALDQRCQIWAGSGSDAEAVPADEVLGHLLFAIRDLRQRGWFDLPAVRS